MSKKSDMSEIDSPLIEFGELDPQDAMIVEDTAGKCDTIESTLQTYCYDDFSAEETPTERIIKAISARCLPNGAPPQIFVMKKK